MAAVTRYFERFQDAEVGVPSQKALLPIANALDEATAKAVEELMGVLRQSEEHRARVALLDEQPRLAGKFSAKKVIFSDASAFEQMVAVQDWLAETAIRKDHTWFFSANTDDYVPVKVKKYKKVDTNLMHVVLGTSRGAHKAPKYADWATTDPWTDGGKQAFIYPLEGLEIVRQPQFSAATVLKGNAFESERIDSEWRYGAEYACVESAGQSRNSPKKRASAGLNACALVSELADVSDPKAEEVNIALPLLYEDYAANGYADDLDLSVTPGEVIRAAKQAIVDEDDGELSSQMKIFTISKIGVPQTPLLREYIAGELVANSK